MQESIIQFQDLELDTHLLRALNEEGYTQPTPIQEQAIPPVLAGKDLLGIAQTGTGKTAAFALPILQRLNASGRSREPRNARALVLTPTRELAIQVEESFRNYGRHLPLRTTCIFGGVGDAPQKAAMQRGVDVLVATPGRLMDLMNQGAVHLKHLEIFVLDEADRMLDMGFIHDIRKVITVLPRERQNLFFSATMPPEIASLANTILRHPVRVEVVPASTPIERIEQCLYFVGKKSKPALLRHLLKDESIERALVFTRMKHMANRVAEHLEKVGISAAAIHGNKSQSHRQKALSGFKDGSVRVLVATDIAARGIDVDGVTHVFNYDLPDIPETYVHRIGRTARAGSSGVAIAFCSSEERDELRQVERLIKIQIPVRDNPDGLQSIEEAPEFIETQQPRGRRNGHGRADRGRDPGRDPRPAAGHTPQQQSQQSQRPQQSQHPQRSQQSQRPQHSQNSQSPQRPQHPQQGRLQQSGTTTDRQPTNVSHENHDPRDQWYGSDRQGQRVQTGRGGGRSRNSNNNNGNTRNQPRESRTTAPQQPNQGQGAGEILGRISKGIGKLFGR